MDILETRIFFIGRGVKDTTSYIDFTFISFMYIDEYTDLRSISGVCIDISEDIESICNWLVFSN